MHDEGHDAPRKLLDSEDDWGLLTMLVMEEHDKETEPVTTDEAKRRYIAAECPSVVFILDWAERHPSHECIRFTGVHVKANRNNGENVADVTGELDVGLSIIGVSPRLWLCYLAARVHELSFGDRAVIEGLCYAYALMVESREAKEIPQSAFN